MSTFETWLRTVLSDRESSRALLVQEPWAAGPGLALLVLGAVTAGAGLARHRSADLALRQRRLPATGTAPALVAGSVAVVAVVLAGLSAVSELS